MPAGKAPNGVLEAAPASGGHHIGALSDEILCRILSLLPAQQAVRTCVLAKRWRHLWKSAPGLRIVGTDGQAPMTFVEVREFVDTLLLLRGSSPLQTFELRVAGAAVDVRRVMLWVRYAMECKVQVLRLSFHGNTLAHMLPEDPPLASRHLTKLELHGLLFNDDFLDFSRCPKLQDLQIQVCSFEHTKRISSQSLRHLSTKDAIFNQSSRARILAPNLASLVLRVGAGRTPVLEKMPLLVKGVVGIARGCKDCCSRSDYGDCGDESCGDCILDDNTSVILHGLSDAKALVLAAFPESGMLRPQIIMFMFMFKALAAPHWRVDALSPPPSRRLYFATSSRYVFVFSGAREEEPGGAVATATQGRWWPQEQIEDARDGERSQGRTMGTGRLSAVISRDKILDTSYWPKGLDSSFES